jgi:hypothetical protein
VTIRELLEIAPILAAVATVLAALVAAFTLFATAVVNARTARVVERDKFRRQIMLENVRPFLVRLDKNLVVYRQFIDAGPVLSKELRAMAKEPPEKMKERAEAAAEGLGELIVQVLGTRELWESTTGASVIFRDQRLLDVSYEWAKATNEFLQLVKRNEHGLTAHPERLDEMSKLARNMMWKATDLRIALEETVIQPRGLAARASYRAIQPVRERWRRWRRMD